jgi:hypothetical protein
MNLFQSRSIKVALASILVIIIAVPVFRFINRLLQIQEKQEIANATEVALFDLISRYKNGDVEFIELKTVTPFDWDRLYVFGPYTRHFSISEIVGSTWSDICVTSIQSDDGIVLLIFTLNGQPVQCVEYGRGNGDFDMLENVRSGISIKDARFVLDRRGNIIVAK